MTGLAITVTDKGRAALVAASGTNAITISAIGISAAAITPATDATVLPGEIKRLATFSGTVTDATTIHLTIRDDSTDSYALRAFALYLSDGTLFGIYGGSPQAATAVGQTTTDTLIMEKAAASLLMLAVDITITGSDVTAITFGDTNFLNPAATTEVQGVVELATEAEATTGTDARRAVTPKGMQAAIKALGIKSAAQHDATDFVPATSYTAADVLAKLQTVDGSGSGLDADSLDGLQASQFVRSDAETNGAVRLICPASDGVSSHLYMATASATGPQGAIRAWNFNINTGGGLDLYAFNGSNWGKLFAMDLAGNASVARNLSVARDANIYGVLNVSPGNVGQLLSLYSSAYAFGVQSNTLYARTAGRFSWFLNGAHSATENSPGTDGTVLATLTQDGLTVHGAIRCDDGLHTSGANGWYNDTFQGGWFMADDIWLRSHNNKSIYTGGNIDCGGAMHIDGQIVWHAGDDGAGSGLDADTLDGKHASDFSVVTAFYNSAYGGYRIWSDGFKECWGVASAAHDGYTYVTYPITFSAWSMALCDGGATSNSAQDNNPTVTASNTATCTIYSALDSACSVYWRAWGY